MDNFGFEADSEEEEEQSDDCRSSESSESSESEEERACQPDLERVLINPYRDDPMISSPQLKDVLETNSVTSFETAKEMQECYCTKCPDLTDGSHCCASLLKDFDKGEAVCICELPRLLKLLDKDVLELALFCYYDTLLISYKTPPENKSLRYSAYRVCSWILFGKLGRKRRRRLPDCLVKMIRETFPEPSGVYIGYRDTGEISEED